jgi:predicted nucleic acid-binding protein
MTGGLYVDSSVLLLAVGGPHPLRDPCREVIAYSARTGTALHCSVEGGQEFLFHRIRRVGSEQGIREFDVVDAMVVWHDFTHDVLRAARSLVAQGHARGRDAVHAATALGAGFGQLVSCDADFDGIPGLARLDPVHDERLRG